MLEKKKPFPLKKLLVLEYAAAFYWNKEGSLRMFYRK